MSHESNVEQFYSHGSDKRRWEADGFLSYGYWRDDTTDYLEAAENLLDFILRETGIDNAESILNVCCGYGAETFRLYEKLRPGHITAIDLTAAHVEHAKERSRERKLSEQIRFEQQDACRLPYDDESFSLVFGVEGPAHFNTRYEFFQEAHRVLKKGGSLVLADIVTGERAFRGGAVTRIGKLCAKHWHMPEANWINVEQYGKQLQEIGFRVEALLPIGDRVFPGFAGFNTTWAATKNAVEQRGLVIGFGLTVISWLLGYVYEKGMSEYLIIKAVKL